MRTVSDESFAADVEEVRDAVGPQDREDLVAVGGVGLVTVGTQRGGRRAGNQFEVVAGFLAEVDKVLVDDAAHTVAGIRRRR